MAQAEAKRLVTANRLRDGVPVYFAGTEAWSPSIDDAVLVPEPDAELLLETAQGGAPPRPVVAPYLIEAELAGDKVHPLSLRERIRAFGPTI
jgi:hypothetical protein